MVLEAKTDAPELALDGSTQAGFCKWFMSLPQVDGWLQQLGRVCHAARNSPSTDRPSCLLPASLSLQDPQVIKFFDRKVCGCMGR